VTFASPNGHAVLQVLEHDRHGRARAFEHQARLTLPGMVSAASHWDQSSEAIGRFLAVFSLEHLSGTVTSQSRSPSKTIQLSEPIANLVPTGER